MPKPSDFYVSVIDFFAVLLPGACLVYLLQPGIQPLFALGALASWLPANETQGWVVFIVLAYITGHMLHAFAGLLLDVIYENDYMRWTRRDYHKAKVIIEAAMKAIPAVVPVFDTEAGQTLLARVALVVNTNANGTKLFDWCMSDVRLNSPAGAIEVDRLLADSKFFRSMVFVFLVAAFLSLGKGSELTSIVTAALAVFAIWRFCELRWFAEIRTYEYYLLGKRKSDVAFYPQYP